MVNSDRPVIEVAKSLGINDSTLRHWVQNAKKDAGGAGGEEQLSASDRAELEELRKFKAQAQMDIAFLKKWRASSRASRSEIRVHLCARREEAGSG